MRTLTKQKGASTSVTLLFIGMAAVLLTIGFKLYPAYYDYWKVSAVLDSYEKDIDIESMTSGEIESNFQTRLLTNNVREFDVEEGFFAERNQDQITISVDYEVRISIYNNIDAVVSFEKTIEKSL